MYSYNNINKKRNFSESNIDNSFFCNLNEQFNKKFKMSSDFINISNKDLFVFRIE